MLTQDDLIFSFEPLPINNYDLLNDNQGNTQKDLTLALNNYKPDLKPTKGKVNNRRKVVSPLNIIAPVFRRQKRSRKTLGYRSSTFTISKFNGQNNLSLTPKNIDNAGLK